MESSEIKITYQLYKGEYPSQYRDLCAAAERAREGAYCIYSHFAVGAAALMGNGEIVTGSNQENAAYPSGICAERTTLFYATARFPEAGVRALAICAADKGVPVKEFVAPCGACRQVMIEVVQRYGYDYDVILMGSETTAVIKASALLPFAFSLSER